MLNYLEEIKTQSDDIRKYSKLTPQIVEECFLLAKNLKKLKIFHINSTENGGGVAEMLKTQIPLEKSLEINSHWLVMRAPEEFFEITKKIHNLLQGEKGKLKDEEKKFYQSWIKEKIGPELKRKIKKENPQIIIIHDPQPLLLIDFIPKNIFTVFRIHIDTSFANKPTLNFFRNWINKYQLGIFTHPNYRPKWWQVEKTRFITPAINPFSDKNKPMRLAQAERILNMFQINTDQPIISQVSRFDLWKDQPSTIQSYYLSKNKFPTLELILAGLFQANDDPEAKKVLEKIKKEAKGDPDIFLFSDPSKLKSISNDLFINAIYTASQIIIQKSIREGFGLVVTEAMWKEKPVIGGKTSGIELQIENGKNGFLASDAKEISQYSIELLKNPSLRRKIGEEAKKTVKEKFLFPKLILEHLKIYNLINN